jgi:predicted N-acetyltransferase YhbS
MKKIELRLEESKDYRCVEELTREAFWNRYVPGCSEHYLIHIMRDSGSFIRDLDTVAEIDGKIVGNIVYTRAKIVGDSGNGYEVVSFGPISVLPGFQGKGIGGMLIEYTRKRAAEMGHRAILIYGDPGYYGRFGFVTAEKYGIGTPGNMYAASLQALELYDGALSGCRGRFLEDPLFDMDESAIMNFDMTFPWKERKNNLPSQEKFKQQLGMMKPR